MTLDTPAPREAKDLSADERWAIWVAKNVEQDRRARNYAIAFAAALAVSGIAALAIALARQV